MRVFYEQSNVGRAKYVVNYHDGKTVHDTDGSPFYDVAIFSNKKKKNSFLNKLRADGYTERETI